MTCACVPQPQEGGAGSEASVHTVIEIVARLIELVSNSSPSKMPPGEPAAVLADYAALGPAQRQHLLDVRTYCLRVPLPIPASDNMSCYFPGEL